MTNHKNTHLNQKETIMKLLPFLTMRKAGLAISLAAVLALASFHPQSASARVAGEVDVTSHSGFDQTVQHLKKAIATNGLMIVGKQDYKMMLGMVGVHADKAMGFHIFHPKFGKTIYENNPTGFEMVPLHVVVLKRGSKVVVIYQKPSAVFQGLSGLTDLGEKLNGVLARIAKEATR